MSDESFVVVTNRRANSKGKMGCSFALSEGFRDGEIGNLE